MSRSEDRVMQPKMERTFAVLRRAMDLAASVVGGVRWLAIAAGAAVAVAWVAAVAEAPPREPAEWAVRVVVLALLLVPSGVLVVFLLGVRALRELPERYRGLPADVRERASDLGDLRARTPERRGLLGSAIGLAKLVIGSRELLTPYAVVAAALRPTLLLAALFAALAALVEIPASLLVVLLVLSI